MSGSGWETLGQWRVTWNGFWEVKLRSNVTHQTTRSFSDCTCDLWHLIEYLLLRHFFSLLFFLLQKPETCKNVAAWYFIQQVSSKRTCKKKCYSSVGEKQWGEKKSVGGEKN